MDVKLKPFDFAQAATRAGMPQVAERVRQSTAGVSPGNFQQAFSQALNSVSAMQANASQLQREVSLGNSKVGLEQTMVAMQKAQIGFQSAMQVRNRLVQAYSEIMNMQI
ncbi:MAG: flagellar hook-basal body complex protein FliE [Aquabacterium sp.]|nr:MAG: flagellar hook-basal body complex protein FliE [Aquabacterium sp.]TAL13903.1 MAG: flagellar hook-basal body complex protein FliE [Aquabacterium sp.]